MITQEENQLLTRVGRGTPAGEMLRRYWQPVALSEELPPGGAPRPVTILGEELALFRDDQGRPGLLGLHCSHRGTDLSYGRVENGVRNTEESHYALVGRDVAPSIDVEVVDFGVRIYTARRQPGGNVYLRVSYFVLPNLSAFPGQTGGEGYSVNWHVPIDDTHHWKYIFVFSRGAALDKKMIQRARSEVGPDYKLLRNRANRFLQDRESMEDKTFSGMGYGFQAHDLFATSSQGEVQDRTTEHLVSSDKPIVAARKLLEKAIQDIQEGREPPNVVREPAKNRYPHLQVISDLLPGDTDIRQHTRKAEDEAKARL